MCIWYHMQPIVEHKVYDNIGCRIQQCWCTYHPFLNVFWRLNNQCPVTSTCVGTDGIGVNSWRYKLCCKIRSSWTIDIRNCRWLLRYHTAHDKQPIHWWRVDMIRNDRYGSSNLTGYKHQIESSISAVCLTANFIALLGKTSNCTMLL